MSNARRLLLLSLLGCCAAGLGAESISSEEYAARLKAIRISLQENAMPEVRRQSQRLLTYTVADGGEVFETDASVLGPLAKAATAQEAPRAAAQLNVLIASLEQGKAMPASGGAAPPDHALLERLRREEVLRDPDAGGEVKLPKVEDRFGIGQTLLQQFKKFVRWVFSLVQRLLTWIRDAMLTINKAEPSEYLGPVTIMLLLTVAGVCALIVLDIMRRNRAAKAAEPAAPAPVRNAARDADPLSRNSSEWELFARQLAASGSHREAIRAWYHAVLVAMYRGGLLHYRKGRTNWEYCYSLSPQIAWRPQFMELTRRFEWERYGRNQSTPEDVEQYAGDAQTILASLQSGGAAR